MVDQPEGLAGQAMEVWEHAGLHCAIVPNPRVGLINGYVQLPEGHPSRASTYDDIDVEVHGGLTYGPDEDGWVGFDTGHFGDYWAPDDLIGFLDEEVLQHFGAQGFAGLAGRYIPDHPTTTPWTIPQLRAEIQALAEQLAAATSAHP